MIKFLTLMFLLVAAVTPLRIASAQEISLNVTLYRSSILPLEPLGILVEMKNETDAPLKLKSRFNPNLRLRQVGSDAWLPYLSQERYLPSGESLTLAPGQSIRSVDWITVDEAKPIDIAARRYTVTSVVGELESAPRLFEVKQLTDGELDAAKYLQEKGLYVYLQRNILRLPLEKLLLAQVEEKFREFIELHPNSQYDSLVKLALIELKTAINFQEHEIQQWIRYGNESKEAIEFISSGIRNAYGEETFKRITTQDYEQSLLMINQEAEKLAPTLPAPFNARGWMLAGKIAMLREDKAAARSYFNKALEVKTKDDVMIQAQVELLKIRYGIVD